jgi:hypothetical protein
MTLSLMIRGKTWIEAVEERAVKECRELSNVLVITAKRPRVRTIQGRRPLPLDDLVVWNERLLLSARIDCVAR